MKPTKAQIARRLRTLANRMADVAADMVYHGGFAEWVRHGKELAGAAGVVLEWADQIDVEAAPAKKAAKKPARKKARK